MFSYFWDTNAIFISPIVKCFWSLYFNDVQHSVIYIENRLEFRFELNR